ncbi:hypothetical protein SAMD00024442_6_28 [Candidatus Symbiothrix dinenymphae]|nr:hypothetical protein SAMD00024442_6_28 [Candidatus Symbiothrix dinenymphae]
MKETKPIYFNAPQQEVMFTAAHTTVFVGGRRLGKTHGIAAPFFLRNVQRMPRSSGAFVVSTYKRGLTNTLPGTLAALDSFGYKRDLHYYIGKKPPKSAGFAKPFIEPAEYEHVISFYNGSIAYIISQDRPGTSNSLTLDYIIGDEAKFLDFEKLKDETFPANGGFKGHFGNRSYHHSMLFISDMPTTKKGSWFLKYEKECDPELIATIQGIIFEIWRIKDRIKNDIAAAKTPPAYLRNTLKKLYKDLAELRSIAVYYKEFSSIDNLLVLGENYIKQMKRDLPPMVFQTSILCKKVGVLKDGFYNNMRESIHYYTMNDNSYLDSLEYHFDKLKEESCLGDADLDRDQPICIAMDYNSNINWIVAGQQQGRTMRVLKSFYVKYERKLRECIQYFCKYYRHQRIKTVVYYYDTTALNGNYAVNDQDFKTVAIQEFEAHGWSVVDVYIGQPMHHIEKHMLINQGFRGQSGLMPMLNSSNNEELLLAMEQTGTRNTTEGFKKDKSGEKLAETEEDKLEYRTDGTDAFDTLYIGMNHFQRLASVGFVTSAFV